MSQCKMSWVVPNMCRFQESTSCHQPVALESCAVLQPCSADPPPVCTVLGLGAAAAVQRPCERSAQQRTRTPAQGLLCAHDSDAATGGGGGSSSSRECISAGGRALHGGTLGAQPLGVAGSLATHKIETTRVLNSLFTAAHVFWSKPLHHVLPAMRSATVCF